ncbi:hypothetical protein POM88_051361 [Heracleum sosnowskyi]|uniref:Uncharacterized protein n=1 Tax=Heracleum sosnowskyi TaxID=360622 RepID=A0AAD8H1S9_9APIA|nr:hypothetical protein POM88_051361 [Heracleum sosnowskyi]
MADCKQPGFTAAASYLCAKRHNLKVDQIKPQSDPNSVSTSLKDLCFDKFGISKEKMDPENREPGRILQIGCGSIPRAPGTQASGALGATYVYPLQDLTTRMYAQKFNVSAGHAGMSYVIKRRTLQHESLRGFQERLALNLHSKAATNLKRAINK